MKYDGIRLKTLRQENGLTQKELADLVNVNQSQISRYEQNTMPEYPTLNKIAKVLNIKIEDLFN